MLFPHPIVALEKLPLLWLWSAPCTKIVEQPLRDLKLLMRSKNWSIHARVWKTSPWLGLNTAVNQFSRRGSASRMILCKIRNKHIAISYKKLITTHLLQVFERTFTGGIVREVLFHDSKNINFRKSPAYNSTIVQLFLHLPKYFWKKMMKE